MSRRRRALAAIGIAGLLAGAVPLGLALDASDGHQRELIAVFGPLTGWAFVGTGVFAWARRPGSRLGLLMTAVGFSWCLAALRVATEPWIFTAGLMFIALQYAVLYHLLLAFPTGTLGSGRERALVAVSYASAVLVHPVQMLFQDTIRMGFPENELLVTAVPGLVEDLTRFRFGLGLALLAAAAVILARRWRAARPSQRRALAPVLVTGGVVMGLLGVWYAATLAGAAEQVQQRLEDARVVLLVTVPFAFLAGLLRSRVAEANAVSELVTRLGQPVERRRGLRDALSDALGDPSLSLAYWLPERGGYVDPSGRRVELPTPETGRACTPIDAGGERLAVIVHDAALGDERELIRTVGAAAALTLQNERLDAELRAKVAELRESRARIVASGDEARRRIERDLHDGAQQRLVSLALSLRMLEPRLETDPTARRELDAARAELDQALGELRDLARGIHPRLLSDRGLEAGLEGLASRTPVPVEIDAALGERLPEPVEATAYFVVSEALTNVAKYSRADAARVEVSSDDGFVRIEVSDDGIGGAEVAGGSGLSGLLDRVAALDGTLEVDSEQGRGTTVRARIPWR